MLVETATGIRHVYGRVGEALYREVPVGSSHHHYVRIPAQDPHDLRVVGDTESVGASSSVSFGSAWRLGEHEVVVAPLLPRAVPTDTGGLTLPMPRVVVDTRNGRTVEEVLHAGDEGPVVYWRVDHLTRQAVPLDADGREVLGEDGASLKLELRTAADGPGLLFLDRDGNVVPDPTVPNSLDAWAPTAGSDNLFDNLDDDYFGSEDDDLVSDPDDLLSEDADADTDAGSEQADAGQGASQLHIAAHQAQGPPVETHTVQSADAPGVLQRRVEGVSGPSEAGPSEAGPSTRPGADRADADRADADRPDADQPGADHPAIRPVRYGDAIDRVLYGDAVGAEVVESERLIADARRQADRQSVPLHELHQGSRELRSAAYEKLWRDAQEALRANPEGRPGRRAGFTVTALPGGGHAVVYTGPAYESANESADVLVNGRGLRIEFDSRQRWTSREYLLGNPPPTMDGLRAVADRTWGPGGEEQITYRLTGANPGAVARFAVHTLPDVRIVPPESAESAESVQGPFVATDDGYGHRYHFGPEGTFTARDTLLEGRWAYLRTEEGAPDGAPRLLDPQGAPWGDWQARNMFDEAGDPVAARIEVRPADDGGAPHQRMAFDSTTGDLHQETVPLRDHEGQLVGYATIDEHPSSADGVFNGTRLDVNGHAVPDNGMPLRASRQPDGDLKVWDIMGWDIMGRVLFRRSAWGTEPVPIPAPGRKQLAPELQTEPPRGTIARPFLQDSRGSLPRVRLGAAVAEGEAQEFQIYAPLSAPGLSLLEGENTRRMGPLQILRDGDRFVIRRSLFAAGRTGR